MHIGSTIEQTASTTCSPIALMYFVHAHVKGTDTHIPHTGALVRFDRKYEYVFNDNNHFRNTGRASQENRTVCVSFLFVFGIFKCGLILTA